MYEFKFAFLIKLFSKNYPSLDKVFSLSVPAAVVTLWHKSESPGELVKPYFAPAKQFVLSEITPLTNSAS